MSTQVNWPGRFLLLAGLVLLSHSAFSVFEHLAYLKAVDKVENGLPIEIVVECLFSVFLSIVGSILVTGPLKEILMETEMAKQTIEKQEGRPSFIIFNHRARRSLVRQEL